MRLATLLFASVVLATGVVNGFAIHKRTTAVTLFTAPSLHGASTTLPSTGTCTNLPPAWDEKIRSLFTAPGFACDFYLNLDCATDDDDGDVLRYGWVRADRLPARFDGAIRSVECGAY
ncbi:uncharacterized protein BDZ99DRAFT_478768 [Mytilinidion resinicola]|uniref:Uncharacterized protein n=1 Tax=Mytilinidion resinicola TaxID=574789 RepID=A0A6A6YGX7_9PEZI|nr:uncharacterized protein BDZ99DRAFT_478768 [Mytilinidion resinicola]KAF2807264.1 hypothetical protein BDZ99DRAFT_478768 [Mytilinidion resinicola]